MNCCCCFHYAFSSLFLCWLTVVCAPPFSLSLSLCLSQVLLLEYIFAAPVQIIFWIKLWEKLIQKYINPELCLIWQQSNHSIDLAYFGISDDVILVSFTMFSEAFSEAKNARKKSKNATSRILIVGGCAVKFCVDYEMAGRHHPHLHSFSQSPKMGEWRVITHSNFFNDKPFSDTL